MASESEAAIPFGQVNSFMAGFNKYGLPGVVIGAQFLIIVGLIYVLVYVAIPALQASTQAMANMTNAVNTLTQTIKESSR